MQTWDSYRNGLWHARSASFYEQPLVQFIGQWRLTPDLITIVGALALVAFVIKAVTHLKPGYPRRRSRGGVAGRSRQQLIDGAGPRARHRPTW